MPRFMLSGAWARCALFVLWLLQPFGTAIGVPACPVACKVEQPGVGLVDVCLKGDEFWHWYEDVGGYTIVQASGGGGWVYAVPDGKGGLEPGPLVVGRDDPSGRGVKRHLRPAGVDRGRPTGGLAGGSGEPKGKLNGRRVNLVVLVDFPDLPHTFSREDFRELLNRKGYSVDGASGSLKDYYREVSYRGLRVDSVVADWIRLDHGYAYYGADKGGQGRDVRPREMVREALAKLQARGFDFSVLDADGNGEVDFVTVVHAGGGQEFSMNDTKYIWSHQWDMLKTVSYDGVTMRKYLTVPERRGLDARPDSQGLTRIGVVCHEMAHTFGLPDLYDAGFDSQGVGNFCLMGSGLWNGDIGTLPAHPGAWCKALLNWVGPVELDASGTYEAPEAETSPAAYRLSGSFPRSQYYLVENRQRIGFDAGLPGPNNGLLIWHIDETVADNNNQKHYRVDLEEASGPQDLERNVSQGDGMDYFRKKNKRSFNAGTTPNNRSYSGEPLGLNIKSVSKTSDSMTFTLVNDQQPVPVPGDDPGE